jgi:hypothetical protein
MDDIQAPIALPNLPHFHSSKPKPASLAHFGRSGLVSGGRVFTTCPHTSQEDGDFTSLRVGEHEDDHARGASKILGEGPEVLRYDAYFKESVNESPLENFRVRKCHILLYLKDGSLQVDEIRTQNSGMPQGCLIKRHRIRGKDGSVLGLDDLSIGETVEIYSRVFHIIDCDESAKKYLLEQGRPQRAGLPFPTDKYEEERRAVEVRLGRGGTDELVDRRKQRNDMKDFVEAALGRTVNNSGREKFLKFNGKVLCFHAIWDDSASLYGEVHRYRLHYFLADDTVEVCTVKSTRYAEPPHLLKRNKLPKDRDGVEGYIEWPDLYIGAEVNVYGRRLVLVSADEFTREWYQNEGMQLQEQEEDLKKHTDEKGTRPPSPGNEERCSTGVHGMDCMTKVAPSITGMQGANPIVLRYSAELESSCPEVIPDTHYL